MSPSGYSKLERGETKLTVERVQQIADILQVSIFDLIATDQSVIHNINGGVGININNGVLNYIDDKIEIERLNLIIKHKEEIIVQKQKENEVLQDLLNKLTNKVTWFLGYFQSILNNILFSYQEKSGHYNRFLFLKINPLTYHRPALWLCLECQQAIQRFWHY